MKKQYIAVEVEVFAIAAQDIITESGNDDNILGEPDPLE